MGWPRRKFTREFKLVAIEPVEAEASVAEVAGAFEVSPNLLHRWRLEFQESPGMAFPGSGQRRAAPNHVAQLERKIGQQALEIDFLKGCLQRIEEQRRLRASRARPLSTSRSKPNETEGTPCR